MSIEKFHGGFTVDLSFLMIVCANLSQIFLLKFYFYFLNKCCKSDISTIDDAVIRIRKVRNIIRQDTGCAALQGFTRFQVQSLVVNQPVMH